MKQINYKALTERLCLMDVRAALIDYIFRTQGAALQRLDYVAAAGELSVSRKTIKRYCDELADKKIIIFEGDGLKLNEDILNEVG